MKPLVTLILAGGVGKRFWPIKKDKLLFPFFNSPFFQHTVLDSIPKVVDRIIVVANSNNEQAVTSFRYPKPAITVIQKNPLGMADAILSAKNELKNSRLLIVIADDIFDKEVLTDILKKASTSDQIFGVLTAYKPRQYFPGGYLVFDGDTIKDVIEKPDEDKLPSEFVNISGYYIADSDILISELAKTISTADDIYEKTLSRLMKTHTFVAHHYTGTFASLKYAWNILDIQKELLNRLYTSNTGKNVTLAKTASVSGNVVMGDNVRIFDHATIIGPCYIGSHTVIGNNTLIRESHIGKQCVIGFGSDITRSYIGDSCWFHNNYVGDSVIEENVSFGYGTGTANFRLDEGIISSTVSGKQVLTRRNKLGVVMGSDIRVGIQTGFMPGVKIGSQSAVGPGLLINRDIPEGSFVEGKTELILKKNNVHIQKRNAF